MPTVRWADLNFTESAGTLAFRDMLLSISPGHIERWKDDPDGRFGLSVSAGPGNGKTAELVKFYPSL